MMARVTKKKAVFGTSMGVSSIIAILVILVLVVFAALSITTAKADLTLSVKTSDGIRAFYEADSEAERKRAEVLDTINANGDGWQAALAEKGYEVSSVTDGTLISYTLPIDDNRNLEVELLYGSTLVRRLWQVVPAKDWVPDESLDLFVPR